MIETQQTEIIIYFENSKDIIENIQNTIFNDIRTFNKCFNKINSLNCAKEVWIDETYISFKFMTKKSFFKALEVIEDY